MRIQTTVLLGLLAGVVGCDDTSSPVTPTPVEPIDPTSSYAAVHRGRCPSDADLPFSVREAGWFWADSCRNNHAEIISLSDWCSGTRQVVRGSCVLNAPTTTPPPPRSPIALTVTGPTSTVRDNGCVVYAISGGTAPYRLTSHGGRWVTAAPCRGDTPTLYTLLSPGQAVWSATGLDVGDSASVSVTDADGARKTLTLSVV